MKRREFIAGLGSAAAWPVVARGQQAGLPLVGVLSSYSPEEYSVESVALLRGLADTGYIEAGMSQPNGAGREINTNDCRCWQRLLFSVAFP